MSRPEFDAVIAGGGLSGLSLAAHLATRGWRDRAVLVIDDMTAEPGYAYQRIQRDSEAIAESALPRRGEPPARRAAHHRLAAARPVPARYRGTAPTGPVRPCAGDCPPWPVARTGRTVEVRQRWEVAMQRSMTRLGRPASDDLLVLEPAEIDRIPWRSVVGCPGVRAKEVCHVDGFVHALIGYDSGAGTPGVPHPAAHHYIWVVSGAATVAGHHLATGSYLYVPPGVAHPIVADPAAGCTLLQLHGPYPPAGPEPVDD
jgi:hypothetical protein